MNEFVVTLNSGKKNVKLIDEKNVEIEGNKFESELIQVFEDNYLLKIGNKFFEVSAEKIDNEKFAVLIKGERIEVEVRSLLREKALKLLANHASAHTSVEIKAPMPGMILKIKKNQGETINQGESILILEAMKMENEVRSPMSGNIQEIFIKEGEPVEKGAKLLKIGQ